MSYDTKVPRELKKTQAWFASIITRPIDEDSQMNPLSPSGVLMEREAFDYISPSPTLRPAQRIQLYNQQYWWRLLNSLQEIFPLLTRLFGYYDFNQQIGIPYIDKYTANHWSLNYLGDRLPQWVEESYDAKDKPLVYNATTIDLAYSHGFFAGKSPPIKLENLPVPNDISSILTHQIFLQSYVFLFDLPYNMFQFRQEILKQEPDYWVENDFPKLDGDSSPYFFVLFRNGQNHLVWDKLSSATYRILKCFQKGISIDQLCGWLEEQDSSIGDEAGEKLHLWLQDWIAREWLYIKPA